jgi:dihydropyrimidinase
MFDLVVRGGDVVTSGTRGLADIGVTDGRVVAIGTDLDRGADELDASGCLVLPGGVDMHVHLTPSTMSGRRLQWADDFDTGTAAAAAGGITVVGNMTFPEAGESLVSALSRTDDEAGSTSRVDYFLHPVLLEPRRSTPESFRELRELGFGSIKIFMHLAPFGDSEPDYIRAIAAAGEQGLLVVMHCEDQAVIEYSTQELVKAGTVGIENFPKTRPVASEVAAVNRAIAYAELTGAAVYVVHLASGAALEAIERAQSRGVRIFVETRPIYLRFTESEFRGPDPGLFVGNPPLRSAADVEALWRGAGSGSVATCCTDHAPWLREQKLGSDVSVLNTRPGMADLEVMLPFLFSEGVLRGRITIERFVELTSTRAARLFGIYPQKGTISVGSDADLLIWDPNETRRVDGSTFESRAKFNIFDGAELTGWPRTTLCRGKVVAERGSASQVPSGWGRRVPSSTVQSV